MRRLSETQEQFLLDVQKAGSSAGVPYRPYDTARILTDSGYLSQSVDDRQWLIYEVTQEGTRYLREFAGKPRRKTDLETTTVDGVTYSRGDLVELRSHGHEYVGIIVRLTRTAADVRYKNKTSVEHLVKGAKLGVKVGPTNIRTAGLHWVEGAKPAGERWPDGMPYGYNVYAHPEIIDPVRGLSSW